VPGSPHFFDGADPALSATSDDITQPSHLALSAPDLQDRVKPLDFGTDPTPFAQLATAFPEALIAGCSTSGEIAGTTVCDASVSVAIARFEHSDLRRAFTVISTAADSFDAGARLAAELAVRDALIRELRAGGTDESVETSVGEG
jgi:hypothetical protein